MLLDFLSSMFKYKFALKLKHSWIAPSNAHCPKMKMIGKKLRKFLFHYRNFPNAKTSPHCRKCLLFWGDFWILFTADPLRILTILESGGASRFQFLSSLLLNLWTFYTCRRKFSISQKYWPQAARVRRKGSSIPKCVFPNKKVRQSQKQIMVSSILPNNDCWDNFQYTKLSQHSFFGKIEDTINCFRDLLTFRAVNDRLPKPSVS